MMPRWRSPSSAAQAGSDTQSHVPAASVKHVHLLSNILLIAGGLILAYPFWSSAYAHVQQTRLDTEYQRDSSRYVDMTEHVVGTAPSSIPDKELVRRLAVAYAASLKPGDAMCRLRIPAISLDRLVQQGVSEAAALDPDGDRALLRNGPVHYAVTPLPGGGEPFAVAGHRTTYGAPFYRLDRLRRGDRIFVDAPYATLSYAVVKTTEVKPTDVTVLLDRGYGLVLTTCTPPYSASHRLIVWASLESATPRQALSLQH